MSYDIPPLRKPEDLPPIKTQDDLCQFWRSLVGELGFSRRYLWVVFLDARGHVLPGLLEIDRCPAKPDRSTLRGLMGMLRGLMDDGPERHSVAFLWSRPGAAATEPADLEWAQAIRQLADDALIPTWPLHHANDHDLRAFAPDELAA